MNIDLPMDGQSVWLVSGICSTGSGQTKSIVAPSKVFWEKPKTLANSVLIIILSFFVVSCRRPVCVSRCYLAPKDLKTSSSNSRVL